jgi:hypothetical protein
MLLRNGGVGWAPTENCPTCAEVGSSERRNGGRVHVAINALKTSSGERSPSTIRGRLFSSFSTAARCSLEWAPRLVPFGKQSRSSRWCKYHDNRPQGVVAAQCEAVDDSAAENSVQAGVASLLFRFSQRTYVVQAR